VRQLNSCLFFKSLFVPGVLLILICAITLRFTSLNTPPLHADEATGASILGKRLEGETYRFDPTHFHGPTLSLFTMPVAALRGEKEWSELQVVTLRLLPAFFSTLTVLLPLLMVRQWGAISCLAGSFLLASSPLLVYYGRVYIHETLLGFFTATTLFAYLKYARNPGITWAISAGVAVGLMVGTKETAIMTLFAWLVSAVMLAGEQWMPAGKRMSSVGSIAPAGKQQLARDAMLHGLSAGVIAALLYTDFFRYPQGLLDFFTTFFVYETTPGHEKGFWQYLEWLLLPKSQLGSTWTEGGLFFLALVGSINSFTASPTRVGRFLCYSLIVHGMIYFRIDYKVPWLMVIPWIHLCLLAGIGVGSLWKILPSWRVPVMVFLGGILSFQALQAYRASVTFPSDARNPYAYVPTSPDVARMRRWMDGLLTLREDAINEDPLVVVIGEQYWPLPWYLRDLPKVGYWESLPAPAEDLPLVLVTGSHADRVADRLRDTHRAFPYGLRHEYLVFLYVREDLWQLYNLDNP